MATRQRGGMGRSQSSGTPFVSGAVAGLIVFVLTYLVTYLVKSGEATIDTGADLAPAVWKQIAWYFFSMHNVGIEVSLGGMSRTSTVDVDMWLLLLPIALLLVAGFAVSYVSGQRDPVQGAIGGATLAISYVILSIVLAFLSSESVSEMGMSASYGPDLIMAVVVAGIAYPVVFGGIGGAVGGLLNQ